MSDTETKKAPRKASAKAKKGEAVSYKEINKLLEDHVNDLQTTNDQLMKHNEMLREGLKEKEKAVSQLKAELHNTVAEVNRMRGYITRIYEEDAEPEIQTTRHPPRREYADGGQMMDYEISTARGGYSREEKKAWWDL